MKLKSLKVALLFDESNDWLRGQFVGYKPQRSNVELMEFYDTEKISSFDIVFILGYSIILPPEFLTQNTLTLVVHESDLPNGKGYAPVQWQILEDKDEIKISLIEALESVDSGDIILQNIIQFDGDELYDDIRLKQARATISIIEDFINIYPNFSRQKQAVGYSFYPKRKPKDGELNITQSIKDNFNLLRIGNNDAWPSFFFYKGNKYIIKIYRDND